MLSLSTPSSADPSFIELTTGRFELNYSFDNVLRWFDLIDSDLPDEAKAFRTFLMFVGAVEATDADVATVFKRVSEDVSHHPYGNTVESEPVGKWDRAFDFELDAGAIYASFMQTYHINLLEEKGKMSWFEFKALLDGLDSESIFERIIRIRKADLSDYKGKQLNEMVDCKEYYSLAQTPEDQKAKSDYEMQKQFDRMGLV